MKRDDQLLSIRLPSSLLYEIELACQDQNEPLSRFVKRALNEYLDYHFQEIAPRLQQVIKSSTVIDVTENSLVIEIW